MPLSYFTVGHLKEVIKDLPDDMKVTITNQNDWTMYPDTAPCVQNYDGTPDTSPVSDDEFEALVTEWIQEDQPDDEEEHRKLLIRGWHKVLAFYTRF